MESFTRGFHPRIVLVFDFDRTLADGTVDAVLAELGVEDSEAWREERLGPMIEDGWDEILAKAELLVRVGREKGRHVTKDLVKDVGARLEPYPGLEAALDRLKAQGDAEADGADVEFYVLSSGFVDVMTAAPFVGAFEAVWGSSLHWDDEGRLAGAKRTVTHSEKGRYLRALAKGLDIMGANEPQHVEVEQPPEDWHVPLDQMIYVGDGASDLAAFNLMRQSGGIAIAVDQSGETDRWGAAEDMFKSARVENLAAPDYREGAEMRRSLELAVGAVARRVALRRFGHGE